MRFATAIFLLILGISSSSDAQTPIPVGAEFRVDSLGRSISSPSVSGRGEHGFVAVWKGRYGGGTDDVASSIYARLFDSSGGPLGDQFQVNTYTPGHQENPAVAADESGDFVVVWDSWGSPGTDNFYSSIQGQRFDSGGSPLGAQFQVNSYRRNEQKYPAVSVSKPGDFVVVWQSRGSDGTDTHGYSVQGQRFDPQGSQLGDQFQVNTTTIGSQYWAGVSQGPTGEFLVVWESGGFGAYGTNRGVMGRRFASNGSPVGSEFQVMSDTSYSVRIPKVTQDLSSNYVVVWYTWSSDGHQGDVHGVHGRKLNSSGIPLGPDFKVNSYTTGYQSSPTVSADDSGGFVVAWTSAGSYWGDDSYSSVQGQRFGSDGQRAGGEFQLNTLTFDYQGSPSLSSSGPGGLAAIWLNRDSGDTSLRGQILNVGGATSEPSLCRIDLETHCLENRRFEVKAAWRDHQGNFGPAKIVLEPSDNSGLFWFFNPDNWEMLVKVIDGCSLNDRFWVFAAATTDVEYNLTIRDSLTGHTVSYHNPLGTSSPAITDTGAFATCP